jgi:hypothetical protein
MIGSLFAFHHTQQAGDPRQRAFLFERKRIPQPARADNLSAAESFLADLRD